MKSTEFGEFGELGEDSFTKVESLPIGVEMEAWTNSHKLIKFKLRSSTSKWIGSIKETPFGEKFKVIGSLNIVVDKRFPYFLVEFLDGTKVITTKISDKRIKNPNLPTIDGVGYRGQGICNTTNHPKEYSTWIDMIHRCYNLKYHKKYPTYKDCTVDERWHNFQNFCEDIQYLEGYKEWKENTNKNAWHLDKDIKIEGNKIYSKDTCMFVTIQENNRKAHKGNAYGITGEVCIGENRTTGEIFSFNNANKFARDHGLCQSGIQACLRGLYSQHNNWIFYIKTPTINIE